MNSDLDLTIPPQGPDCAAVAPLLPLAGQRLLDERDATQLREHLAGCGHCQALLAAYDRLDAALVRRADRQVQGLEGLTEAIMDHIEDQQNPLPPPTAPLPAPPPPPARGRRGLITSAGAIAAVLAIAVVSAALFAGRGPHGTGPGGRVPFPSPTPPGPQLSVGNIAMVSPSDGWALAQYTTAACFLPPSPSAFPSPGTPFMPALNPGCKTNNLMLHYDGQTWRYAGAMDFEIQGSLTMASASEGWALASDAISHRTEVVHYSGGHWFVDGKYAFPEKANGIEGLAMVSTNDSWAIGFDSTTNTTPFPPSLFHYTQGQWAPVHLPGIPSEGQLHSISMLNANEGWAVGWTVDPTYGPVLILHYHNGTWTKEDVAFPGSLNSVYTVSPDEAWAVGEENPSSGPGLILHYKAGTWTKVTGLQLNILHAVTMVSPTEGWAVGDGAMFMHYANGVWSKVGQTIHHFAVGSVSMGSATDGWATGGGEDFTRPNGGYSILFHYTGGEWTPYPLDALMRQLASQLGKG